jgi:hypothetical protein
MKIAQIAHSKQSAGERDRVYHFAVQHPPDYYLCVVWYDQTDPSDEPLVTLWGPLATEKECRESYCRFSRGAPPRTSGDWQALPGVAQEEIGSRIRAGLLRLAAH